MKQLTHTIIKICKCVEDGTESPFEALANFKRLEKELKDAIKFTNEYAVAEAEKYNDKTFNQGDHQFTLVSGRRSFSFKNIVEWADQKKELSEIELKYKTAFASYEKGLTLINDDAEVMQMPEVTYSKDVLSVKIDYNIIKS